MTEEQMQNLPAETAIVMGGDNLVTMMAIMNEDAERTMLATIASAAIAINLPMALVPCYR